MMLRNDCTFVRNAVKIVKDNNINDLEEETAKAVKSCSISTLNEKMISVFSEQVNETLKIDKFFNFHHLH